MPRDGSLLKLFTLDITKYILTKTKIINKYFNQYQSHPNINIIMAKKTPPTKKVSIQIEGMHCASCATNIERSLTKEKGVNEANVNYATNKALVNFDENQVSQKKLASIIEKQGYGTSIVDPDTGETHIPGDHDHHGGLHQAKRTFIWSFIFGIPLLYISMGRMLGLPQPQISLIANYSLQFLLTTIIMKFGPLFGHGENDSAHQS